MKKKLQLNELKIQSFVTSETDQIKGGSVETTVVQGTQFSCYRNISCNPLACYIRTMEGLVCNNVAVTSNC